VLGVVFVLKGDTFELKNTSIIASVKQTVYVSQYIESMNGI
jgi:hypothetical protein